MILFHKGRERAYVLSVKQELARVVHTVAIDVAAHRRLARAALGRDKVVLALLEGEVLQPHFALVLFSAGKHRRQRISQFNRVHETNA